LSKACYCRKYAKAHGPYFEERTAWFIFGAHDIVLVKSGVITLNSRRTQRFRKIVNFIVLFLFFTPENPSYARMLFNDPL
jgi:hypothetical protein